ncbi:MAG: tetratricopeptide repeat protein [Acidobacteriota bacterium]
MKGYSTKEVGKLLGLSEGELRGYVRAGFLAPERGPRRQLLFSFQDLVFLRTARGLTAARVAPRRIRRALQRLREQLPDGKPLTAVRIAVEGSRIVVEDGARRWQPESGQILFDFGVADLARKVAPLVRRAFRQAREAVPDFSADDWFAWACELEPGSPGQAREAYERVLELQPDHADAHVNLGRIQHESGDPKGALPHYRRALASRPDDPTAAFNLGVALEDLGRPEQALEAYERAVAIDPENADAHFNAASVAERLGQAAAALRHLRTYRKLTRP